MGISETLQQNQGNIDAIAGYFARKRQAQETADRMARLNDLLAQKKEVNQGGIAAPLQNPSGGQIPSIQEPTMGSRQESMGVYDLDPAALSRAGIFNSPEQEMAFAAKKDEIRRQGMKERLRNVAPGANVVDAETGRTIASNPRILTPKPVPRPLERIKPGDFVRDPATGKWTQIGHPKVSAADASNSVNDFFLYDENTGDPVSIAPGVNGKQKAQARGQLTRELDAAQKAQDAVRVHMADIDPTSEDPHSVEQRNAAQASIQHWQERANDVQKHLKALRSSSKAPIPKPPVVPPVVQSPHPAVPTGAPSVRLPPVIPQHGAPPAKKRTATNKQTGQKMQYDEATDAWTPIPVQ